MGKIFVTSDNHFFHKNIITFENRPYETVEEMNEDMIKRWNAKVTNDDSVYILGDFSFGGYADTASLLERLNGKKFLIKGNHDHVFKHREVARHFEWIKDYHVLRYADRKVVMFHFPIQVWDGQHYGAIHLYGHVHSNDGEHRMEHSIVNSFNVGVDVHGYTPVELDYFISKTQDINLNR